MASLLDDKLTGSTVSSAHLILAIRAAPGPALASGGQPGLPVLTRCGLAT
ncbi:MAG TPA: hypothetical protein VGI64_08425 [Streptosporangiaceae bacterium]|jgi:hypothetical protein